MEGKEYPRTCAVHGLGPCRVPDLAPQYVAGASETPVQSAPEPDRVVARVVTSYGLSVAYGPYPSEYAVHLAEELTEGNWMQESWLAVEIGRLPGEPALPTRATAHRDEEEVKRLYQVLEQRRDVVPCPSCGSLNNPHTCPVREDLDGWKD